MSCEVVHISCFNKTTESLETLRVTSATHFVAGGFSYYPCIDEMFDFSQSLFSRGTTAGEISVGVGTLVLNNSEGILDSYREYGFDGRLIEVYKPSGADAGELDQSDLFFSGVIAYAEFGWDKVTFYIKNRLEELNVPMQPETLAGTNSGLGAAGGYEGGEQQKGRTKPQIFGRCSSVEGTPVNDFFLIYAFNYDHQGEMKPLHSIYNVYVKGIRYIYNANYTSLESLRTADLTVLGPGYFVTCMAKGVIRLSSTPADNGAVVADVADAPDAACTAAQVAKRILDTNTDYIAGQDYDSAELLALDSVNTCPVGIAVSDDITIADALNQVLDSIGCWYIPDASGLFRFGYLSAVPDLLAMGQLPVATITRAQWDDTIERISVADDGKNIPAHSVEILHTKNWHVQQSGGLADAVEPHMREFFTKEYRKATVKDDATLTAHPLAPMLSYATLLNTGVYLHLRNGNFTVNVESVGNGWTYVPGKDGSQYANSGILTINTESEDLGYISQTFTLGSSVFNGDVEFVFTVKQGSRATVTITVDSVDVLVKNCPETANATVDEIFVIPVSTLLADSGDLVTIKISSYELNSSTELCSVFFRMVQQGKSPLVEAARRLRIQSSFQERYALTVPLQFYKDNGIAIGKLVILQDDTRFGLEEGKEFIVIGADPNGDDYTIELDVWRAEG